MAIEVLRGKGFDGIWPKYGGGGGELDCSFGGDGEEMGRWGGKLRGFIEQHFSKHFDLLEIRLLLTWHSRPNPFLSPPKQCSLTTLSPPLPPLASFPLQADFTEKGSPGDFEWARGERLLELLLRS